MRILYIAPMESIHSRRWVGYFASRGNEVHVADIGESPQDPLPGTVHHYLPLPPRKLPPVLDYFARYRPTRKHLRELIERTAPDLVHVHWLGVFAHMAATIGRHPLVATAWGSDILIYPRRSLAARRFARTALRRSDVITCDAEHMVDAMVRLGADRGRVRIVYFGTDLTCFNPGRRDDQLARELGFPADAPLVISLRALKPVYDVETFIRAAALVARQMPMARFVVVGDGPERQRLEDLARELGVVEAVRFTGRLSDEDLLRNTASADVYVSTSLSDAGLAASTSEAMACAVPVVITRFGNNGDWVQEGRTGSLFEPRDHEELARKVLAFLQNPERARAIGTAGRMVIEERNNWHREMEKVERLYHELAAGGATITSIRETRNRQTEAHRAKER